MKNIRIDLEFDGADFSGWQIQATDRTVQGELKRAIDRITKEDVTIVGAGRTDTGVHALQMTANFKTASTMLPNEYVRAFNSLLPPDIIIRQASEVDDEFSARYSVTERHYVYKLRNRWTVFNRRYVYVPPKFPDIKLMYACTRRIVGYRDFAALGNVSDSMPTTIRDVTGINFEILPNEGIDIYVSANAFLYRMVRNIVALLLRAGIGELSPDDIAAIIEGKDRSVVGVPAPAAGLYFFKADY